MIRFIQDYVTKALPPESFTADQEVTRSPESELYFVRLGVAGFLVDGQLVDQDYRPIVRETVVVVTTDRRFADTGRGGEVIGVGAPQRATSGPGNEVVFSGQPDSTALSSVEATQLGTDLAAVRGEFDTYRSTSEGEVERLKGLIETGNDAFREMNNSHVDDKSKLTEERDQARTALSAALQAHDGLVGERDALRSDLDAATARISELEAALAAATPPPADEPAATKRGK